MRAIEIGINTNTKLITEECCNCGVLFAMPEALRESLLTTGKTFYCPTGHSQFYSESTAKLLRETEDKLWRAKNRNIDLTEQLDGTLVQLGDKKKELMKLKRRVKAGVCTECHRHFENLQRHMESKHK